MILQIFHSLAASSHKCVKAFAAPSTSSRHCNVMTVVLTTSYRQCNVMTVVLTTSYRAHLAPFHRKCVVNPRQTRCLRHKKNNKNVHTQLVSIAVHHRCVLLLFRVVSR